MTAVLGAMQSEVRGIAAAMDVSDAGEIAGHAYWVGELAGEPLILGHCGIGKVAAAAGLQRMLDSWPVDRVVVCGLAGGLAPGIQVGDLVIGSQFIHHDLDASPLFPRYVVPGLGQSLFAADKALVAAAEAASWAVAAALPGSDLARSLTHLGHGIAEEPLRIPAVHTGLIATGDQFVSGHQRLSLVERLPRALCVDMEGAAVAQVCHDNQVPFVVIRVISDTADGNAPTDFARFVDELAASYTVAIVAELMADLS